MSKEQLVDLAKKYTATQIKNKYFVNIEVLRAIYAEHNIHHYLRFSNEFVKKIYLYFNQNKFKTCNYLGMSVPDLYAVPNIRTSLNCRFKKANRVCQDLGYKSSIDYIQKEGAVKFRNEIKNKL